MRLKSERLRKNTGEIGYSLTVVWSQNLKDSFCKTGMLQTQLRHDCAAFPPQVSEKTEEWKTDLKEKIETRSEPKHRATGETVKTRSKIQQSQWILAAKEILTPLSKGTLVRVKTYSSFPTLSWIYILVGCKQRTACSKMGRRLQELLAPALLLPPAPGDKSTLWGGTAPSQLSCALAENLLNWRSSALALEGKKLEFVTGGAQLQQNPGTSRHLEQD